MLIKTKSDFNEFTDRFRTELTKSLGFIIKPSKTRELIAKCAGFKSHNNLISALPVDANIWLEGATATKLNQLINEFNGKKIHSINILRSAFSTVSVRINTSTPNTIKCA